MSNLGDFIRKIYRNCSIEEQRLYEYRGKYFYFDYVVKKDNFEVAIIEVKQNIEKNKSYITSYSKLIQSLFPRISPLIIFFDEVKESFYLWDYEKLRKLSKDKLYCNIKNKDVPRINNIDENKFLECLETLNNNLDNRLSLFIAKIKEKHQEGTLSSIIEKEGRTFSFIDEYEKNFFLQILNKDSSNNQYSDLYKYTSFNIMYNTIDEDNQGIASIVAMNDKTECTYADNYLRRISYTLPTEAKDITPNYKKESEFYIMSCNNQEERLFMWNMYGEQGYGVRLHYKLKELKQNFIIAPVDYAENSDKHTTLDEINNLLSVDYGLTFKFSKWDVWKHFFKPYEFSEENEIRILYSSECENNNLEKVEWIFNSDIIFPLLKFKLSSFPYAIDTILLGPKINGEKNVEMLKNYLKHKGKEEIKVFKSSIQSL